MRLLNNACEISCKGTLTLPTHVTGPTTTTRYGRGRAAGGREPPKGLRGRVAKPESNPQSKQNNKGPGSRGENPNAKTNRYHRKKP